MLIYRKKDGVQSAAHKITSKRREGFWEVSFP